MAEASRLTMQEVAMLVMSVVSGQMTAEQAKAVRRQIDDARRPTDAADGGEARRP